MSIAAHQLLAAIDRLNGNLCAGLFWWERTGALPDFSTDTASIQDADTLQEGAILDKMAYNDEVYLVDGWDRNKIWDGTSIRNAGDDAAPAPTIAAGAGTGLTGSYHAVYSYYDSVHDYETAPTSSPPAAITLTNQTLAVNVQASSNSRYDKIRIYRNAAGVSGTFLLDTETTNTTQTVNLSKADTTLGSAALYPSVPPICRSVTKTSSRMFWGGSRPWTKGTATFTQNSTTVAMSDPPPPDLFTRDSNAPIYIRKRGGPRYAITAISGNNVTITPAYRDVTAAGASYSIKGLGNRLWFADLNADGIIRTEAWQSANFFILGIEGDSSDGDFEDEIYGLREHGNRIYAFMRESVWYWDPLIREVKKTGARVGTFSKKTIKKDRDNNLIYCGSDQQVYVFNGFATVMISQEVRNRFADKNRYALDLAEYAFAYYDEKEGLYNLCRPAYGATLASMKYVVDVYDDYRGKWIERNAPRLTAACKVRDVTRHSMLGIDNLGMVHVIDNYDQSCTFGADKFTLVTPTVLTSAGGEISPGADSKGKVAVVYNSSGLKGGKIITSSATANAPTIDLADAITVAAGDSYLIGGWPATYETQWIDLGEPDLFKAFFFLNGTFIYGSSGFLFVTWYADESPTAVQSPIVIPIHSNRSFKRAIPCRARQIKIKFDAATELVGFACRELSLSYRVLGDN